MSEYSRKFYTIVVLLNRNASCHMKILALACQKCVPRSFDDEDWLL